MLDFTLNNVANINRQLGCLLRDGRIKAGLSQEAAAERIDVDAKTWRNYELGESPVPAAVLLPLFPEMQEIFEKHLSENRCNGKCWKCKKPHKRVRRSENVGQDKRYGPKEDR